MSGWHMGLVQGLLIQGVSITTSQQEDHSAYVFFELCNMTTDCDVTGLMHICLHYVKQSKAGEVVQPASSSTCLAPNVRSDTRQKA